MSTDTLFNSVALVDKSGSLRAISPRNSDIIGQKLTSQASRQALELQKPLMSEPYKAVTNRLILLVSHPVFDGNGSYNGFISGTIYLQEPNSLKKYWVSNRRPLTAPIIMSSMQQAISSIIQTLNVLGKM